MNTVGNNFSLFIKFYGRRYKFLQENHTTHLFAGSSKLTYLVQHAYIFFYILEQTFQKDERYCTIVIVNK